MKTSSSACDAVAGRLCGSHCSWCTDTLAERPLWRVIEPARNYVIALKLSVVATLPLVEGDGQRVVGRGEPACQAEEELAGALAKLELAAASTWPGAPLRQDHLTNELA